jgi:hypothetical protein
VAPGVSASERAISARATSGRVARTAAISSSNEAAGPIGGGIRQSGLFPRRGISSHRGPSSSSAAAPRMRRSHAEW